MNDYKTVKKVKLGFTLFVLLGFIAFSTNTFSAESIDKRFTTCGENGQLRYVNGKSIEEEFSSIALEINTLDTSGNYSYYGVDIGVFTESGQNLETWLPVVPVQRVHTDNLIIKVTDFGDMNSYNYNQPYVLGYRVLYEPIGAYDSTMIAETEWIKNDNYFFTVLPPKVMTHDQIISYGGKSILVSDPDNPNIADSNELEIYNGYKTFIDKDYVTYSFGFNITNTGGFDKAKIYLNLNTLKDNGTNVDGVNLKLLNNKIKLINTDTGEVCDTALLNISGSNNVYTIEISSNNLKGSGFYNLEYRCQLNIRTSNNDMVIYKIKNTGLVQLIDVVGAQENVISTIGNKLIDKNWIVTNISKRSVIYR